MEFFKVCFFYSALGVRYYHHCSSTKSPPSRGTAGIRTRDPPCGFGRQARWTISCMPHSILAAPCTIQDIRLPCLWLYFKNIHISLSVKYVCIASQSKNTLKRMLHCLVPWSSEHRLTSIQTIPFFLSRRKCGLDRKFPMNDTDLDLNNSEYAIRIVSFWQPITYFFTKQVDLRSRSRICELMCSELLVPGICL